MKKEIRIIAWDDCAFGFRQKYVTAVGVVFRGAAFLDGLLSTKTTKDGTDSTDMIAKSVLDSRHYDQLSYIMLNGITIAGFNVVDIKGLNERTKLPVIAVQRRKPDMKEFMAALGKLNDSKKKLQAVKKAGKFFRFSFRGKEILYQKAGAGNEACEELLRITCIRGNIPEPLRVAHLIASGLSGESHGRA
ncbi:MAG: DUF99 family protein [Candidatus Aenigmarchaeota archaeon]|nr:DUF99 family protein [Candidatus Aenigmarchaeota archaeon]